MYVAIIAMASSMFLNSCKKDDVETAAPTISFSGSDSQEIDSTTNNVVFNVYLAAEAEIETFTITKKTYSTSTTTAAITPASGFKGETSYTYNFDQMPYAEFTTGVTKIEYVFNVTDKDGRGVEKIFTVTKKATVVTNPLAAAVAVTWSREGSTAGTGLTTYGLKWTSNAKVISAVIVKDVATKLVELSATSWTSITTKDALALAVDNGTDLASFKGIGVEASGTYDKVIAVKNGTEYYMIHLTNCTISTVTAGTKAVITGESKK